MGTLTNKLSQIPAVIYGIMGAVVLLGSVAGGAFFMSDRFAHADDVRQSMQAIQQGLQKTNARITMMAMQQRIDALEEQMWKIENQCSTRDVMAMPVSERDRYRRLQKQRDQLERQLAAMEKQMAGGKP